MEWFKGEVPEAVRTVKEKSKVLLVFIKGTDEESEFVASQFGGQIAAICDKLICLQLDASSHTTAQFSAVYAVLTVPCIYLIDSTGQVIDVKLGRIDSKGLKNWIASSIQSTNSDLWKTESQLSSPSVIPTEINETTGENTVNPQASSSQTIVKNSERSLDERLEYARQLIDAQKRQKEEESRKKSVDAEIERRETGKALHEFKELQKQREIQEALAERRKEEAESRKQLEKLRQQIEEDRKVREEKWQCMNGLQSTVTESPVSGVQEIPRSSFNSDEVRLQLRSLEGGHLVQRFPSTATLSGDVRNWLQEMASRNFQFDDDSPVLNESTSRIFTNLITKGYRFLELHPKRLLEPEEECQSLKELGYCPSAALFLVSSRPNQAISLPAGVNNVYGFVTWALSGVYSLGQGLLYSVTGSRTQQPPSNSVDLSGTSRNHSVRRQGNVARLSHMPDNSDDEQARWNGNSTEQL
ncbi:unnamed protein product [Heterobilharzia americana]|nr:unnamed protein product [Heterobilharzia americana]